MAKTDALTRLGGGRWETKDGRFQIEPQSGTWVIVDTTQTNEFGLPLVRGPFPSLTAAKEAIEAAASRVRSSRRWPDRIGKAAAAPAAKSTEDRRRRSRRRRTAKRRTRPRARAANHRRPPEPKWIRDLRPVDRRKATELIDRLEGLGIATEQAEAVARAEIAQGLPAVARLAIERRDPGRDRQRQRTRMPRSPRRSRRSSPARTRTSASRGASSTTAAARSRSST